jgi:hypothetical protein
LTDAVNTISEDDIKLAVETVIKEALKVLKVVLDFVIEIGNTTLGTALTGYSIYKAIAAGSKLGWLTGYKKLGDKLALTGKLTFALDALAGISDVLANSDSMSASEIASKLRDYGPLNERVFKVTRNGAAGNMQTTYAISYIPVYDKPEAVPADFSAFNNFNIAKHSFWEKSLEDINTFLATGSFPEYVRPQAANQAPAEGAYVAPTAFNAPAAPTFNTQPAPATPAYQAPTAPAAPTYTAPAAPVAPATTEAPAAPSTVTTDRPARNFGGFSF